MRVYRRSFPYRFLVYVLCFLLTGGWPLTAGAEPIVVTDDRTVTVASDSAGQRYQVGDTAGRTGSLTFNIAPGQTLTFRGLVNPSADACLGNGGAINLNVPGSGDGSLANPYRSPLRFGGGGKLVFSGNRAAYGGAAGVWLDGAGQDAVLDFVGPASVSFIGNEAASVGGGIYSVSDGGVSSVNLGPHALFAGNRAGGGGSGWGGAIYSNHDLSLAGHTLFEGNRAGKNGTPAGGSQGGAVVLRGWGAANNALLDTGAGAAAGPIAFRNNYREVQFDHPGNPLDAAKANSLHLARNTALHIKGDGNVYFDDPISSGTDGNNSLLKEGAGFVQFVGDNRLNTAGFTGPNSVDIRAGSFRVVNDRASESFNASGAGAFNVAAGASLAGYGRITAGSDGFSISGLIAPDSDRFEIPAFNYADNSFAAGRDTVSPDKRIGRLVLDGDVTMNGATLNIDIDDTAAQKTDVVQVYGSLSGSGNKINLTSWGVIYNSILSAQIGVDLSVFNSGVTFLGQALPTADRTMAAVFSYIANTDLALGTSQPDNTTLYWRGGAGAWDLTTQNWTDTPGNSGETNFIARDYVIFDGNNGANETASVSVAGQGQQVSGLAITGGSYTFQSTPGQAAVIYGLASAQNLNGTNDTPSGQLWLTTPGATTLNLATAFENGASMSQGTLVLGHDKALGQWAEAAARGHDAPADTTSMKGQLLVYGSANSTVKSGYDGQDRSIITRFQLGRRAFTNEVQDSGAGLTFDVASGKTLTISGVKNTSTNLYHGAGGAISVLVPGQGTGNGESPLKFAGGGKLVFSGNSANNGGAVGVFFASSSQNAVLDFTGLGSVSFAGNSAASSGGGIGSISNASSSSVTLGDNAAFTGNIAGNARLGAGGGIYSYSYAYSNASSSVTLGDNAAFTGNIVGNTGEGNGGAIYSYGRSVSAVALGSNSSFTGNIAGNGGEGHGGALFSEAWDRSSVTLGANASFAGNIAGNASFGSGAAIYSKAQGGSSFVRLGDNASFVGNSAGKAGVFGWGGGIYSGGDDAAEVRLGDGASFTGNIAGHEGSGGGIYSFTDSGASTVEVGKNASFMGNIAGNTGQGYGGGILSVSYSPGSTTAVNLGAGALFSGNRAGGNNKGGQGGAIYSGHNLSLAAHTLFRGNLASAGPNSQGGAVYLGGLANSSGTQNTASLDTGSGATAGAIAFSGNYANVDTSDPDKIDPSSGTANSIHLAGNTKFELKGDGNIYFDDPISSGPAADGGKNSLTKEGRGFVQFAGLSVLNPDGAAGGGVAVNNGSFRVVQGASFSTGGNNGQTFDVAYTDSTTYGSLAGGGAIHSLNGFNIKGALSPDGDRIAIPDYDATTHTFAAGGGVAAGKNIGTLSLNGDTTLDGASLKIDLGADNTSDRVAVTGNVSYGSNPSSVTIGAWRAGNFTILTGTGAGYAAGFNPSVSLNNGMALGSRQGAKLIFAADSVTLSTNTLENIDIRWSGAVNGTWNTADANWLPVTGALDVEKYNPNDYVFFGGGAANEDVTLAGDVYVSGMKVDGGNYTFSGHSITGSDDVDVSGQTVTGQLLITNNATATFKNNVTFNRGLQIDGGARAVLAGSGNFNLDITNNGSLAFDKDAAHTHAGRISGSGDLEKTGDGKLTLSGANTYSGATKVLNGTLAVSKASALGQSSGLSLSGYTIFEMNIAQGDKETFALPISSTTTEGGLTKWGGGTAVLSADNSAFSGKTDVWAGSLLVNGSLGGNAIVHDQASLGGNGSIGGQVTVKSGGSIAPGNSIGTLSADSVVFEAGSYFDVEVNPADASEGDLLAVTAASIEAGAKVRHQGAGTDMDYPLEGRTWTILTASAGLSGEFDSEALTNYAMLKGLVSHTASTVELELKRTASFESFARTGNQGAVAGAISSQDPANPVRNAVTGILGDGNDVRAAYDQLNGEIHPGLHGAVMESDRAFAGRLRNRLSHPPIPAAPEGDGTGLVTASGGQATEFWLTAEGFRSQTDAGGGTARAVYKGQGVSLGGEKRFEAFTLGGAFHYSGDKYKIDARNSEADIDSFNLGLYGAYAFSDWQLKLGASYGLHQVDTERSVSFMGEKLEADYNLHSFQAFSELAYTAALGDFTLEPYAGLAWNFSHSESFKEAGGDSALKARAKSNDNATSTVGVRLGYRPAEQVNVELDLDWRHLYGDRRPDSRFTFSGSRAFDIEGAPLERDSLGAGLSVGVDFSDTFTLKAGYNGRFGGDSEHNSGFLSLEFKF